MTSLRSQIAMRWANISLFSKCSWCYGGFITVANGINMYQSPLYQEKKVLGWFGIKQTRMIEFRIISCCVLKGFIYKLFFPISILGPILAIFAEDDSFETHFIPFSRHNKFPTLEWPTSDE
jgi:hypothetical protein